MRSAGLPPRSCVHAPARNPTERTGLIIGATNTPITGRISMTSSAT
jgi:hypothetical protein